MTKVDFLSFPSPLVDYFVSHRTEQYVCHDGGRDDCNLMAMTPVVTWELTWRTTHLLEVYIPKNKDHSRSMTLFVTKSTVSPLSSLYIFVGLKYHPEDVSGCVTREESSPFFRPPTRRVAQSFSDTTPKLSFKRT